MLGIGVYSNTDGHKGIFELPATIEGDIMPLLHF